MLVLGFLLGIGATIVLVVILAQGLMFRVNESRYGFDETNAMIEARAQELRWGIQHQYDLQASLKKQDFEVDSVRVFSLCKPSLAYQVLGADSERMVSAIMPCRVSVYLRKNGKTYVSRMNGAMMSKFLPKTVRQAMKMAALENEMLLEPILK